MGMISASEKARKYYNSSRRKKWFKPIIYKGKTIFVGKEYEVRPEGRKFYEDEVGYNLQISQKNNIVSIDPESVNVFLFNNPEEQMGSKKDVVDLAKKIIDNSLVERSSMI